MMGQPQRRRSTAAAALQALWCICATSRMNARRLQSCDNEVWLSVSAYPELPTAYPDVEGCYVYDDYAAYGLPVYIKEVAVGSTAIAVGAQDTVIVLSPNYYWTLFELTAVDTDEGTLSARSICYWNSRGSHPPSTPENPGEDWWCHESIHDSSLPRDPEGSYSDFYWDYTPLVRDKKIIVTCGCTAPALSSTPAPTRSSTMAPVSAAPVRPPTAAPTTPPTPAPAVTPAPTSTRPTPRLTVTPVALVVPPAAATVTPAPVMRAPGDGDASTPTPAPLAGSRDIVTTGSPTEVGIPPLSSTPGPSIGGDDGAGGASSVPTSAAGGGVFPAATWSWASFRVVVVFAGSIGRSFGLFSAMF